MAWIKFDKDLIDDPRVLKAAGALAERYEVSVTRLSGNGFSTGSDLPAAEVLSIMRNAVTGALVTLWVYADTHIRDGDELRLSVPDIDMMVGIDGFCELVGPSWVEETNHGGTVKLPGYCEKNGLLSREKRRTANAERQRRFREKHNEEVTPLRNADVTGLDQDLDLDIKKETSAPKNGAASKSVDNSQILESLLLDDGSEFQVRQSLVAQLEPLYPAVDIPATVREMKGWLVLNPDRRKTRRGVKSFIGKWLQREQVKHGG